MRMIRGNELRQFAPQQPNEADDDFSLDRSRGGNSAGDCPDY
ncbi:hypothetical protein OHS81_34725 [Streptomyces sp. NBC_00400]